jgi:hypothetical protein
VFWNKEIRRISVTLWIRIQTGIGNPDHGSNTELFFSLTTIISKANNFRNPLPNISGSAIPIRNTAPDPDPHSH